MYIPHCKCFGLVVLVVVHKSADLDGYGYVSSGWIQPRNYGDGTAIWEESAGGIDDGTTTALPILHRQDLSDLDLV